MTEMYGTTSGGVTTRLDLIGGVTLPITYNILDIRNPDTNVSHWSKTLKIPGTKTNNQFFKHIFEIGSSFVEDEEVGFNPNKKADIYFLQDTLEVLRGVLQLKKIIRNEKTLEIIHYECLAFGGSDDLFTKLGNDMLTDLDFSEFNHVYNKANQTASWNPTLGEGYVYPMIDYTYHPNSDQNWEVEHFYPAIFVKEYIDKIFERAGKTYSSAFFTSDFFKRLIIPFSKDPGQWYSDAEILAREFRVERTTNYDVAIPSPGNIGAGRIPYDNESTGTAYDPSNVYNAVSMEWVVPAGQAGYYNIEARAELCHRLNVTFSAFGSFAGPVKIYSHMRIFKNGAMVTSEGFSADYALGTWGSPTSDFHRQWVTTKLENHFLNVGDEISISISTYFDSSVPVGSIGAGTMVTRTFPGAYFRNELVQKLAEGSTVRMNNCIPDNVQIREFLLSLINMFRLYVEEDRENVNKYIIEPRDDYYQETVLDWSDKLDYKKGLEILPMAELQARRYGFRYKEDKDYYNDDYQNKHKLDGKPRTYGDHFVDVDNDFVTNEIVMQPLFSPTPSVGWDSHTRVVPAMFSMDGDVFTHKGLNPRILYWGGLKNFTGKPWFHIDHVTSSATTKTQYPYAGHLDDPFAPTLDLSFRGPLEVAWKTRKEAVLTSNTLYNRFHSRALEEIIDPDSRLVVGHFRLKPTDIFRLSFRKLYYFEKEFYRLNKIIDYDLDSEKLTKCEFIKAKDHGAYVPVTKFIQGGYDTYHDETDTFPPNPPPKPPPWHNDHNPRENSVLGKDNHIASTAYGVGIVGDENIVGGSSHAIIIIGSGNIVSSAVENVTLIHCNGLTVEESDKLYINNCEMATCPVEQSDVDSSISTSFNARSGQATLVAGTVLVTDPLVTAASVIVVTANVNTITGVLYVTPAVGNFTINSTAGGDGGQVNYCIVQY